MGLASGSMDLQSEGSAQVRWRRFLWFFGVLELLFRPAIGLLLPVDLAGDEAYYWEWGQHLDWGYFSKPPGIAWLMALADWAGGGSAAGIRITASILGAAGAWCVVLTARRCFNTDVAILAGLAWLLTPANCALHLLLTIDAPLVFFWSLSLWAVVEWMARSGKSWFHAVALAFGIAGGVLSKQMMLIFFPLLLAALITDRSLRPLLRRPQLWVAAVAGHSGLLPPLFWNAGNNWITLQHTMHHFESAAPTFGRRVARFFEFLGAEAGLVTPVLFCLILTSGVVVIRRWKVVESWVRLFWWMSFPSMAAMLALTWRQRVNPNWPAVFLVGGTLMAAGWFGRRRSEPALPTGAGGSGEPRRDWLRLAVRVSAAFTAVTYITMILLTSGLVRFPGMDPSARIRGWSGLADDIAARVNSHIEAGTVREPHFWVTISHRFLTSEMAFYLDGNPRVYRFSPEPDILRSQHDLWANPSVLTGQDAIIVVQGPPANLPEAMRDYFENLEILEIIENPERRKKWRTLSLFHGSNLQYWPQKDLLNARHQ